MNSGANADESGRDADPASAGCGTESAEDRATGLAGLRTWPAVYALVLVLFAGYIVLLIALERAFP